MKATCPFLACRTDYAVPPLRSLRNHDSAVPLPCVACAIMTPQSLPCVACAIMTQLCLFLLGCFRRASWIGYRSQLQVRGAFQKEKGGAGGPMWPSRVTFHSSSLTGTWPVQHCAPALSITLPWVLRVFGGGPACALYPTCPPVLRLLNR